MALQDVGYSIGPAAFYQASNPTMSVITNAYGATTLYTLTAYPGTPPVVNALSPAVGIPIMAATPATDYGFGNYRIDVIPSTQTTLNFTGLLPPVFQITNATLYTPLPITVLSPSGDRRPVEHHLSVWQRVCDQYRGQHELHPPRRRALQGFLAGRDANGVLLHKPVFRRQRPDGYPQHELLQHPVLCLRRQHLAHVHLLRLYVGVDPQYSLHGAHFAGQHQRHHLFHGGADWICSAVRPWHLCLLPHHLDYPFRDVQQCHHLHDQCRRSPGIAILGVRLNLAVLQRTFRSQRHSRGHRDHPSLLSGGEPGQQHQLDANHV